MKSLVGLAKIVSALLLSLKPGILPCGKRAVQRESTSEQVERVKGKAELLARLGVN